MNERRTNSMAMVDRALGWREPGEEERYVVNPSPIPKFENPNLYMSAARHLFGAGREQRIYAIPSHTRVVRLDFENCPFDAGKAGHVCALFAEDESDLDEVIVNDAGGRMFVFSDTDHCRERCAAGFGGPVATKVEVQVGCEDVGRDLRAGDVIGIVGDSGSGKSTLLSCMSGQMTPDCGMVRFMRRTERPAIRNECRNATAARRCAATGPLSAACSDDRGRIRCGAFAEHVSDALGRVLPAVWHSAVRPWRCRGEADRRVKRTPRGPCCGARGFLRPQRWC